MAEQTQTSEITKQQISYSGGFLDIVTNTLEKVRKFSNEPAVQRSVPVMITLFVIFIGMILFVLFRNHPEQRFFLHCLSTKNQEL